MIKIIAANNLLFIHIYIQFANILYLPLFHDLKNISRLPMDVVTPVENFIVTR